MPPFKFDSQHFFLTYPQSGDLEWQEIIDHIRTLGDIDWARVCKEPHADGTPHHHVVGKFSRRFQTRNCHAFDVRGKHPKIEPTRSIPKALEYVSKHGEFHDIGTIPSVGCSDDEALALATDPDEGKYLRACLKARIPFQYAKRMRELAFQDTTNVIDVLYEACLQWECEALQSQAMPENCSVVLVGPAGTGKTSWAKRMAPKPCLWVSHIDVLRLFRPGHHKSIIFDDMVFTHWPVQTQIHLLDWTDARQIHCRYGYASIPAQTVKIFTCNEFPFTNGNAAINRRMTLINL